MLLNVSALSQHVARLWAAAASCHNTEQLLLGTTFTASKIFTTTCDMHYATFYSGMFEYFFFVGQHVTNHAMRTQPPLDEALSTL